MKGLITGMKAHKINYDRLTAFFSFLYIAATVIGVVLTNKYYIQNLGTGISPLTILIDAIPLMACLPILLKNLKLLQVDERLPIMFFSLILISFSLIQILNVLMSLGSDVSVYYIIDIIQMVLHVAAAVFMILAIIGRDVTGVGKTCAWGGFGITVALFLTSLSLYDQEGIIHITLFPQIASCASAVLMAVLFMKIEKAKEEAQQA